MKNLEIQDKVTSIIESVLGVEDASFIHAGTTFEEINMNKLDTLELAYESESVFNIEVSNQEVLDVGTIGEYVDLLLDKMVGKC